MSWLSDLFSAKKETTTRESARNRLQVVLIHDRESRDGPDFLPQLKLDIILAIKKYMPVNDDQVQVNLSQHDETSTMMEVSVSLDPMYDEVIPSAKERYANDNEINRIKPFNAPKEDQKLTPEENATETSEQASAEKKD